MRRCLGNLCVAGCPRVGCFASVDASRRESLPCVSPTRVPSGDACTVNSVRRYNVEKHEVKFPKVTFGNHHSGCINASCVTRVHHLCPFVRLQSLLRPLVQLREAAVTGCAESLSPQHNTGTRGVFSCCATCLRNGKSTCPTHCMLQRTVTVQCELCEDHTKL